MDVKNVVDKFSASIDFTKTDYTSNDLVKLLKTAISKKNTSKKTVGATSSSEALKEKKPLSAYNIFIRERMEEYKTEELAPKDKLKKAVEAWNEHKKSLITSSS